MLPIPLTFLKRRYLRGPKNETSGPPYPPHADRLLQRADKESLLGQHGTVVWMTGLSGSGKSTIAIGLERCSTKGVLARCWMATTFAPGSTTTSASAIPTAAENIRRIAEVAKLFAQNGVVTICCFVSPTIAVREQARTIIGEADFSEVFVDTPLEECERRDVKGLYAKARAGEVKDFTGISAPFEAPPSPDSCT